MRRTWNWMMRKWKEAKRRRLAEKAEQEWRQRVAATLRQDDSQGMDSRGDESVWVLFTVVDNLSRPFPGGRYLIGGLCLVIFGTGLLLHNTFSSHLERYKPHLTGAERAEHFQWIAEMHGVIALFLYALSRDRGRTALILVLAWIVWSIALCSWVVIESIIIGEDL